MSDVAVKVLTLAFHQATPENEAVCAFLKARRMVPSNPDFSGFLRSGTNASSAKAPDTKIDSWSGSWKLTIQVRKLPLLFSILSGYKETPYYTIENLSDSWNAIGCVKLKLRVFLGDRESKTFENYFDKLFEENIMN